MTGSLIIPDMSVGTQPKEAAVFVVALAWVIMIGSGAGAAILICGWKGAKNVILDWIRMRATFSCR